MIEQIAKTAHSVHRAYCIANNISTQPEWDSVEQEHKEVVYNSIKSILNKEVLSDEISKGNIKLKNITLYDLISEMDDTSSCDFGPG